MSPASFDHLILPFDSKVIDLIRSRGGVVLVHMHGAIGSMLEQVAALGANALDPLEGPPGGNVDLGEAKRRIGIGFVCWEISMIWLSLRQRTMISSMPAVRIVCVKLVPAADTSLAEHPLDFLPPDSTNSGL